MIKKIIILGVVLGLMGIGQIWAANTQEKNAEFKLISPKELLKELEKTDNKRLKSWTLFIGTIDQNTRWNNTLEAVRPDEKVWLELYPLIKDELEILGNSFKNNFLKIRKNLLDQNFQFADFEKGFNEFKSLCKKILSLIQKHLDSSRPEHQKILKIFNAALKNIDRKPFAVNELTETEKNYCTKIYGSINLILCWGKSYFATKLEEFNQKVRKNPEQYPEDKITKIINFFNERIELFDKKFVEATNTKKTIDIILSDGKLDKNQEREEFHSHFNKLENLLEEFINIIKTLPEFRVFPE